MWYRIVIVVVLLLGSIEVWAQGGPGVGPAPGIQLQDEGTGQGRIQTLNCVGESIACAKSGVTGTATITSHVTPTVQATTSGDTITFSSIPAGVFRITISFNDVSLSGTANVFVQIGDSGGLEATGYVSTTVTVADAVATVGISSTIGFIMRASNAGVIQSGHMILMLQDPATNTWVSSHDVKRGGGSANVGGGSKSLSGVLDRVAIIAGGADTFDGGSVNITYEQ